MKWVCKIFSHLQAFLSSIQTPDLQINPAPQALQKNDQNHFLIALRPCQTLRGLSPSNRLGHLAGHR
jgi:hypothetical protein